MHCSELIQLIEPLAVCSYENNYYPILSCIAFNGGFFYASNDVQIVRLRAGSFAKDLSGCVNAKDFIRLLKTVKDGILDISIDKHDKLVIKSGSSKFTLDLQPFSKFELALSSVPFETQNEEPIPSTIFTAIKACSYSVNHDISRPEEHGIYLISSDSGTVLCSTDNLTISHYKLCDNALGDSPVCVTLSSNLCNILLHLPVETYFEITLGVSAGGEVYLNVYDGDAPLYTVVSKTLGESQPYGDLFQLISRSKKEVNRIKEKGSPDLIEDLIPVLNRAVLLKRVSSVKIVNGKMEVLTSDNKTKILDTVDTKCPTNLEFSVDLFLLKRISSYVQYVYFLSEFICLKHGDFTHLISTTD